MVAVVAGGRQPKEVPVMATGLCKINNFLENDTSIDLTTPKARLGWIPQPIEQEQVMVNFVGGYVSIVNFCFADEKLTRSKKQQIYQYT